jgi:hypothetical protein
MVSKTHTNGDQIIRFCETVVSSPPLFWPSHFRKVWDFEANFFSQKFFEPPQKSSVEECPVRKKMDGDDEGVTSRPVLSRPVPTRAAQLAPSLNVLHHLLGSQ